MSILIYKLLYTTIYINFSGGGGPPSRRPAFSNGLYIMLGSLSIYKKWLILFVVLLSFYILYREYHRRVSIANIKNLYPTFEQEDLSHRGGPPPPPPAKEGFTSPISSGPRNLPLTQYFIKASYNSCLENGILKKTLSTDQLVKTINQGYRFLDFELCYINGVVSVCANQTYMDESNQNDVDPIKFDDVITAIRDNAFSSSTSKVSNTNEPLIIHLRLKNTTLTEDSKKTYYNSVATSLSNLGNYINKKNLVLNNITLDSVTRGKYAPCFVLLDITNISNSYSSSDLVNYICSTTGFTQKASHQLFFYDDLDNTIKDYNGNTISTSKTTTYNNFRIVIPRNQTIKTTYYPFDYVKNYGSQIVTQTAYLNDTNMAKYNNIFLNSYGSLTAFVSMDSVIRMSLQDVRYDMEADIKTGIYISIILVIAVYAMFSIYSP